MASARGAVLPYTGNAAPSSRTCSDEEAGGDKCSYEAERDKRVAKVRQMMEPLVKASKIW